MTTNYMETTNELHAVIAAAGQICQTCNLTEVCSESVLHAILDNANLTAHIALLNTGCNIPALKRAVTKRLKAKGGVTPPESVNMSIAVEGLLILNRMDKKADRYSSLHLLTTVLKNNNTAAARLLKSERIGLTAQNKLTFKPVLN